jgi:hypothetical protein
MTNEAPGMNTHDELLKARLEAVKDAHKRTRLVLFVSVVVCLSIIFVYWNVHLAWIKRISLENDFTKTPEVQGKFEQEYLAGWIRSHWISVPVFGINLHADDVHQLGAFSLFIIAIWLLTCFKRENRTIGALLIDSKGLSSELRKLILHSVISYLIFVDTKEGTEPIRDLTRPHDEGTFNLLAFITNKGIIYLPVLTMMFVLGLEIWSTFIFVSPAATVDGNSTSLFNYWIAKDHNRLIQYLVYSGISIAFTVSVCFIAYQSSKLQGYTSNVVKAFAELPDAVA